MNGNATTTYAMTRRRLFISFSYRDVQQARGFNLLQYNKHVTTSFSSRHLLSPVNSTSKSYIWRRIRENMRGTSATVVLLGDKTYESKWVAREIRKTYKMGRGVLAIRLKGSDGPLPENSPVADAIKEAGAEVLDWEPNKFNSAVERCLKQTRYASKLTGAASGLPASFSNRGNC